MSIKPILFNTDMVRAILDGKKTVTRRVIPERILDKYYDYDEYCNCVMPSDIPCHRSYENEFFMSHARYQPGDILYVREAWCQVGKDVDRDLFGNDGDMWDGMYLYRADETDLSDIGAWRPSIHMPKEAARIWLIVTDVRVERLQDMNLDDFLSEGVVIRPEAFNDPENAYMQARREFAKIWDSTIRKSQTDLNPWVWVIEFERCKKPEVDDA